MATNQTENLKLNLPSEEDVVDINELNENFTALDEADFRPIKGENGAHGLRFRPEDGTLEYFDEVSEQWIVICCINGILATQGGDIITACTGKLNSKV